jgi:hypothetical protein
MLELIIIPVVFVRGAVKSETINDLYDRKSLFRSPWIAEQCMAIIQKIQIYTHARILFVRGAVKSETIIDLNE